MAVNNEFDDDFTENDLYEKKRAEENEKRIRDLREQIDELQEKNRHYRISTWNKKDDLIEFLDGYVDEIEDMIFQCFSPKALSDAFGVPQYKMFLWTKDTKHKKRIEMALEFSAEFRMHKSEAVIEKYINDPRLTVQQAGLVRELALHHSRMAGFRQPRVFGKAPDNAPKAPTINIVSPEDMGKLIEELRQKRLSGETVDGEAHEI